MTPEPPVAVSGSTSATAVLPRAGRERFRRLLVWAAACAGVLGVAAGVAAVIYLNAGLKTGERLAEEGRWPEAEAAVSRYLRLWPSDPGGRLLMAEILVRSTDSMKEPGEAVQAIEKAVRHLDRVPDSSAEAAEARLRAARLVFLLLRRPVDAERRIRRAIELNPDFYQAYLLLWSVLDMTQRPEEAEPVFRRVVELSPERERVVHARHWHMSQFAPATVNAELDIKMGVLTPDERPSYRSNVVRFETFRAAEPGAPLHAANAAATLERAGHGREAFGVLEELGPKAAASDPYVAAVRAEVTFNLGDMDEFSECMENWPAPRSGHRYRRWHGIYLEEIAGDYAGALEEYDRTLDRWPGSLDWQLAFRKANCLRRLGRLEEAEAASERATELERLTGPEEQTRIGDAMTDLADASRLAPVVEFYESIGQPREAEIWRRHVTALRESVTRPSPSRSWP